jgi:hypothetical protein
MMKNMEHVELGEIKIPRYYHTFDKDDKQMVCDKIIDVLLTHIDKELDPYENRIDFLNMVLRSTLISNEEEENYEVCIVIKDCITRLNEA